MGKPKQENRNSPGKSNLNISCYVQFKFEKKNENIFEIHMHRGREGGKWKKRLRNGKWHFPRDKEQHCMKIRQKLKHDKEIYIYKITQEFFISNWTILTWTWGKYFKSIFLRYGKYDLRKQDKTSKNTNKQTKNEQMNIGDEKKTLNYK